MSLIVQAQPKLTKAELKKYLETLPRPSHRKRDHEFRDEYGGSAWPLPLPRCPHGVLVNPASWLVQERSFDRDPDTDEWVLDGWQSPWCEVCNAKLGVGIEHLRDLFSTNSAFVKWVDKSCENSRAPIPRKLEPGEMRYDRSQESFDRWKIEPEHFNAEILTTEGNLTRDLRLQLDYETGERKWETMHGYIRVPGGYGRQTGNFGAGPDADVQDLRRMWIDESCGIANREDSASDRLYPWRSASPQPGQFVTPENWMPCPLPFHRGPVLTNDINVSPFNWPSEESEPAKEWKKDPAPQSYSFVRSAAITRQDPPRAWPFANSVREPAPTEKQLAAWRKKHGIKPHRIAPRMPLRRKPRWEDNWRDERPMQDLAASVGMYLYGYGSKLPDQTPRPHDERVIQTATMCAKAQENYREARLALAATHGVERPRPWPCDSSGHCGRPDRTWRPMPSGYGTCAVTPMWKRMDALVGTTIRTWDGDSRAIRWTDFMGDMFARANFHDDAWAGVRQVTRFVPTTVEESILYKRNDDATAKKEYLSKLARDARRESTWTMTPELTEWLAALARRVGADKARAASLGAS